MSELDQVLDSIMTHDMKEFEKQKRQMTNDARQFIGRRFILARHPTHDPPFYATIINIIGDRTLTMSIMLGDPVEWDVHVRDVEDRKISVVGNAGDEDEAVRRVERAVRDIEHFFAVQAGLSRTKIDEAPKGNVWDDIDVLARKVRDAVLAAERKHEREECAKLCDAEHLSQDTHFEWRAAASLLAKKIRTRSDNTPKSEKP